MKSISKQSKIPKTANFGQLYIRTVVAGIIYGVVVLTTEVLP